MMTPCIRVCTIHEGTALCLSCGRTLGEIASWGSYTDAGRDRVMAELPARMLALAARGLPPAREDMPAAGGHGRKGARR